MRLKEDSGTICKRQMGKRTFKFHCNQSRIRKFRAKLKIYKMRKTQLNSLEEQYKRFSLS